MFVVVTHHSFKIMTVQEGLFIFRIEVHRQVVGSPDALFKVVILGAQPDGLILHLAVRYRYADLSRIIIGIAEGKVAVYAQLIVEKLGGKACCIFKNLLVCIQSVLTIDKVANRISSRHGKRSVRVEQG